MPTVLLDTNIVSYLMKARPEAAAYRPLLEGHTLAISFMTVAELYEGAYRSNWGQNKIEHLASILKNYVVVPFSIGACQNWAAIRTERKHQPISVDDAWIAATARTLGCPLVTHNPNDFGGVSGLQIITTLAS
jgi:tRNA(fMet)-specific endonuclease VapC